jgi:hypothetical protein
MQSVPIDNSTYVNRLFYFTYLINPLYIVTPAETGCVRNKVYNDKNSHKHIKL